MAWVGRRRRRRYSSSKPVLIIHGDRGTLLDPGGVYVFPRVISNVATYIDIDKIDNIIFSHQDPDVSSGITLWLANTPAKVYIPKLWTRFLPHFGIADFSRVIGVDDRGTSLNLSNGSSLDIVPAHYLHSVGQINVFDRR